MKFLKDLFSRSKYAVLAAFLGLAGVAVAQTAYYGWNPSTGLEVMHGSDVSGGALPVLSGCATISASVGGASAGRFQTSGTTCNLVITFPSAAPNGWYCTAANITNKTATNAFFLTSTTTTSCTFTATTVASDNVIWNAVGY